MGRDRERARRGESKYEESSNHGESEQATGLANCSYHHGPTMDRARERERDRLQTAANSEPVER